MNAWGGIEKITPQKQRKKKFNYMTKTITFLISRNCLGITPDP